MHVYKLRILHGNNAYSKSNINKSFPLCNVDCHYLWLLISIATWIFIGDVKRQYYGYKTKSNG